jgi:hypothetical protein
MPGIRTLGDYIVAIVTLATLATLVTAKFD